MVDTLADRVHREWHLTSGDANNSVHPHSLSRKISDNNNNHNQNHHHHQHHLLVQSPPSITTTDYSNPTPSTFMSVSNALFNRKSLDTSYDTDGGIGAPASTSRHQLRSSKDYEYLASSRSSPRRSSAQSPNQLSLVPLQQHPSHRAHLTVSPSSAIVQQHSDRDEEPIHGGDKHRRHIRLSRRIHQPSSSKNHEAHINRPSVLSRNDRMFTASPSAQPLRLIFMRHSERANQALGPDWFIKAFRTNTYKAYDQNLPIVLPKRRDEQAYEFDAPLTVRGLKAARNTGRSMISNNLLVDVCLSSTALRCIQTCERVLTGMDRRDRIPIRIEPGLFECPHLNQKIVDSFMTKKELIENGYNIKQEYKSLIQKVNIPESLDEYFQRSVHVMHGIIDRYAHHGGTILIVTHAPGLLALTDAIKGIRPSHDTFYRTVAAYPPLAMYIADYDGTKWRHSEQPFNIASHGQ